MNTTLYKYRVFNKYNLIAFLVILIGLFASYIIVSPVMENLPFTFDYKYEMEENGRTYEEAEADRLARLELFCTYEIYMGESSSVAVFLTALAPMAAMVFINEKKGLFQYKFSRGKKYGRTIITTMVSNGLISALWIFGAYLIFVTVGLTFNSMTYTLDMTSFNFITEGFYEKYMYLYYVLCGFLQYFLFSFVYFMFGAAVYLLTEKKHFAIMVPIAYFFIVTILVNSFGSIRYIPALEYIVPDNVTSFGTYFLENGKEIIAALTSLLPPIIFIVWTVILKVRGCERI